VLFLSAGKVYTLSRQAFPKVEMVEKEKQVPFFTIRAVFYKILFLQIRRQKHFF